MLLMTSIWGKGTFILCRKSRPYSHPAKKWAYTDKVSKSSVSTVQHLTGYEQNTKISQQSTISPRAKHQSWPNTILTNPLETSFTFLNQCRRRKKIPPESLPSAEDGLTVRQSAFPLMEKQALCDLGKSPKRWLNFGAERPWPWTQSTRRHHQAESFACQTWFFWDLPPVPKSVGPSENSQFNARTWSTTTTELTDSWLFRIFLFFFFLSLSLAQLIAGTNALLQKEFFWNEK